ncbi:MAG: hypothetical protein WDO73_01050 [Ignavibacteriota bacterium]
MNAPVTASVGGKSANVLFAGLTTPGLYLVRNVVPMDLAAGPQALQVSVGGFLTWCCRWPPRRRLKVG